MDGCSEAQLTIHIGDRLVRDLVMAIISDSLTKVRILLAIARSHKINLNTERSSFQHVFGNFLMFRVQTDNTYDPYINHSSAVRRHNSPSLLEIGETVLSVAARFADTEAILDEILAYQYMYDECEPAGSDGDTPTAPRDNDEGGNEWNNHRGVAKGEICFRVDPNSALNIFPEDHFAPTPLWNASIRSHKPMVRRLLEVGADFFRGPSSAIGLAAQNHDLPLIELLLHQRREPVIPGSDDGENASSSYERELLLFSPCQVGASLFGSGGVAGNVSRGGGGGPLHGAVSPMLRNNNAEIIQYLLERGADVDGRCTNAHHHAFDDAHTNRNKSNDDDKYSAIRNGNNNASDCCVSSHAACTYCPTPLLVASSNKGRMRTYRRSTPALGGDADIRDAQQMEEEEEEEEEAKWAREEDYTANIALLLRWGADVNARVDEGCPHTSSAPSSFSSSSITVLHKAMLSGHSPQCVETLQLLLDNGADVDALDCCNNDGGEGGKGLTALGWAYKSGRFFCRNAKLIALLESESSSGGGAVWGQ